MKKDKPIKYFSMFSGIGGFEYGIEQAYSNKQSAEIEQDRQRGNRDIDERGRDVLSTSRAVPLCIGFSEIDKHAIAIYKKHFPKHKGYGSATDIDWNEVPGFDILVGGFPCQAFSIAGKRKGFEDTRGTLFFEIARALSVKRPELCILENVKGLLSHDKGRTFETILATLSELGYVCEWQVLNSKNHGVPQNRERVFIVGHLGGIGGRTIFPIGESNQEYNKVITEIDTGHQGNTIYNTNGIATTLNANGGGQGGKTGLYAMRWQRTEKGKQARRESQKKGKDYTPFSDGAREIVPVEGKAVGALTSQAIAKDSLIGKNQRIRRLTPMECERLQGFPDNWTKHGDDGKEISDTQRYKCCGNAVTTNVITAVFKNIAA